MSRTCVYNLPALFLTIWFMLPVPLSSAGVTVNFEPQGGFDFSGTAGKAINYAAAYLNRQAAAGPDGQALSLSGSYYELNLYIQSVNQDLQRFNQCTQCSEETHDLGGPPGTASESYKTALDYLARHLRQSPGDLNLHTAVAVISLGSSRQNAQRRFERMVSTNPSSAIGHCFLAYLALHEEDQSGFGTHFEEAIQADPTYVPAYNSLAMFYNNLGKSDEALRVLTQGLARFPNEATFFYNQAYIHARQHRWDAAQVSLQNAVTRQPTQENQLMLGMVLLKRQDYRNAQTVFESMLDMNPKDVLALLGLATSYKKRHHFAMAISLTEQAVAIDPANQEIQTELQEHKDAHEQWKTQQKEK